MFALALGDVFRQLSGSRRETETRRVTRGRVARGGCYEVVFAIETRNVASDWSLENHAKGRPLDVEPLDKFPALVTVIVESRLKVAGLEILHLHFYRLVLVLPFYLR